MEASLQNSGLIKTKAAYQNSMNFHIGSFNRSYFMLVQQMQSLKFRLFIDMLMFQLTA